MTNNVEIATYAGSAIIPADKELHERQIKATGRQIDGLVYDLYGLTEEEIGGRDNHLRSKAMGEDRSCAQKRSKRQRFQMNLEAFPNVGKLVGRSKLKTEFKPNLYMQDTCIVQYFTAPPYPSVLKYLDDALAALTSIPGFITKAQNLAKLRTTEEGFAEFNSVLIELWFAAQFARQGMEVICEPETTVGRRAEFKVIASGIDVYFEVLNLESPGKMVVDVISEEWWPRRRLRRANDIIRQAFYRFPYSYMVNLQPCHDLGGDEQEFDAGMQKFLTELRDLLRDIDQSKLGLPKQPIHLPKDRPLLTVLSIRKLAGLGYAWIGWGEYSVNRLQKLAVAAQGKIRSKGPQLAPSAGNVLIVGLPINTHSPQAFAQELLDPLAGTNDRAFLASEACVSELGKKIAKRVSALVFFQPADRIDSYPGWGTLVRNPQGWSRHPLPKAIEMVLTRCCE